MNIQEIRESVYLEKGYYIIRSYLSKSMTNYIRDYWINKTKFSTASFDKHKDIYPNCPDGSSRTKETQTHFNFFWNAPKNQSSYSTAWRMASLRNQIEGNQPEAFFLPHYKTPGEPDFRRYVTSYRIAITHSEGGIEPHFDWGLDHSKLQMSLMLSSYGIDYTEGGMIIYDKFRGGNPVNISKKENLKAGDLIIFRYAHKHGIAPIKSKNSIGFGRILLPLESISYKKESLAEKIKEYSKIHLNNIHHFLFPNKPSIFVNSNNGIVKKQRDGLYYNSEIGKMMQIAVKKGIAPSHVYNYRGLWGRFQIFQEWQFDTLKKLGLKRNHSFLDIGCGILKLGLPLIQYLDDDKYCGVDPIKSYVDIGHVYAHEIIKTKKKYHLLVNDQFDFTFYNRKFDFAIAHSVFTHLSFDSIKHCLQNLKNVMNINGKFLFTISVHEDEEWEELYLEDIPMTKSKHLDFEFYKDIASKLNLSFEIFDKSFHPTQRACLFTF